MSAVGLVATGCGPQRSTALELSTFAEAGPVRPVVDTDEVVRARLSSGSYRVVPGDLLNLEIPEILRAITDDGGPLRKNGQFACRVDDAGAIGLPAVGKLNVAGKRLAEIETAVGSAYFPKFVVSLPPVVARIEEHQTVKVSVVGAVFKPGIYELRSDEMSLVSLLMKAEGIVEDGAAAVNIHRSGESGEVKKLALPIRGLNIPFADVSLTGGETVEVERVDQRIFTVVGLANKPGAYPYPEGVQYNLMEALGFAGGIDDAAAPSFLKVYRQDRHGQVVSAVFPVGSKAAAQAYGVKIKPGDVISLDHTLATRTRQILSQIVRIQTGLSYWVGR